MDLKNTLAAVSLSAAIIVLWGLFFAPDPQEIKEAQLNKEINEQVQNEDAPKLIENEEIKVLSRDNAINQTDRIIFENENIVGSISLTGAVIDDLTFKKYTTSVNGDEKVTLLNPKEIKTGYYIDSGWAINNNEIETPNNKTVWKVDGNNKLTPNTPVKLKWTNSNITFEKIIELDDKFLFNIEQRIINNSEKTYNFYPYGQIIRKELPEIIDFFILHEGPIGVFDQQLVEKDYKDIIDKKFSKNASEGFLGITDKYWLTSLIPEKNKKFRADFEYKEKFKVNFVETEPIEIQPNGQINSEIKIIIAAKEVGIKVPLVVRLEGTNVELGKKILEESDLNITTADTMKDAASTVVSLI